MLAFIGVACWLFICEKKRQRVAEEQRLEKEFRIKKSINDFTKNEANLLELESKVELR